MEGWTGSNAIENGRLRFDRLAIIFKNGVLRAVYYWQILVPIDLSMGQLKLVWDS